MALSATKLMDRASRVSGSLAITHDATGSDRIANVTNEHRFNINLSSSAFIDRSAVNPIGHEVPVTT
jgi:hypothetical protein